MVRQPTMNLLSIKNLFSRNTGGPLNANRIKQLDSEEVDRMISNVNLALRSKPI